MSWVEDELQSKAESVSAEEHRRQSNALELTKCDEHFKNKILPYEMIVTGLVDEANKHLEKVGEAILFESSNDRFDFTVPKYKEAYYSIKADTSDSGRTYAVLYYHDRRGISVPGILEMRNFAVLKHINLGHLNKDNMITMVGIINGKGRPYLGSVDLKKQFANLVPISKWVYLCVFIIAAALVKIVLS